MNIERYEKARAPEQPDDNGAMELPHNEDDLMAAAEPTPAAAEPTPLEVEEPEEESVPAEPPTEPPTDPRPPATMTESRRKSVDPPAPSAETHIVQGPPPPVMPLEPHDMDETEEEEEVPSTPEPALDAPPLAVEKSEPTTSAPKPVAAVAVATPVIKEDEPLPSSTVEATTQPGTTTPKPAATTDAKRPSPQKSSRSSSVRSSGKPGEVIILGGTKSLSRSRSSDVPGVTSTPSYELRESKSADAAIVTPSRQSSTKAAPVVKTPASSSSSSQRQPSQRKSSSTGKKAAVAAGVGGVAVAGAAAGTAVARGGGGGGGGTPSAPPSSQMMSQEAFADEEVPSAPLKATPSAMEEGKALSSVAPDKGAASFAKKAAGDDEGPVAINHNFSSQPKPKGILGMSRPAMAAVMVAGAAAAGLGAWTAVTIPDLNSQVKDLEEQVDRLSFQVDRLEAENDRFEASNNRLNNTISELSLENEELNETSIRLTAVSQDLSVQVEELDSLNDDIREANAKIAAQTVVLNVTNELLRLSVATLNATVTGLELQQKVLEINEENLETQITELNVVKVTLTAQEKILSTRVDRLNNETAELNSQLADLDEVVVYLNTSLNGNQELLNTTTLEMAEAIDTDRFLGVQTMKMGHLDAWHGWDCGFAKAFPNSMDDQTAVIAENNTTEPLSDMLVFVDTWLSVPQCFNHSDLVAYLDDKYDITPSPNQMTTQNLRSGVDTYTPAGIDYYFPPRDSTVGMSTEEWEATNYTCAGMTEFFKWT